MNIIQIVTLAVVFVAGLVLGNIAGNITGYAQKGTSVIISPDTINLDVTKDQQVSVVVNAAETVRKEASIHNAKGNLRVEGTAGRLDLCASSTCSKGTYTLEYTIPQERGAYYIKILNKVGNEAGRASFVVQ